MKGADEYARLFRVGNYQFGRLAIVAGCHARGLTFEVYVLPEGEKAKWNGQGNPPLNDDAVEVYGVVSGEPGWTEAYGWLHTGKWIQDFQRIVEKKQAEKAEKETAEIEEKSKLIKERECRNARLLADY